MKNQLREMMEGDKDCCAIQIRELDKKGISYDKLWDEKLYSEASIFT